MTAATVVAILVLVAAAAALILPLRRRRRIELPELQAVQRRIDELASAPAPDELYRAPDLSKAQKRKLRIRSHPVPRKRGGRPWGS